MLDAAACLRTLGRVAVFFALSMSLACGGCAELLDPQNYIDVNDFVDTGDLGTPDPETPDAGPGDASFDPKDTDFEFDFSTPDTSGQPFALHAVVPNFGPVSGDTQVRITGTGLQEGSTVLIGSREMSVSLAAGALVGRVPPASGPGTASVKVLSHDGESRVLVDAFTYVTDLAIDEVTPYAIPTTGGVEVTIRGTGFAPQTGVSFSGDEALRVSYIDDTQLRVLAPPRARGVAHVRVTTPAATVIEREAVRYFEPLRIDAVEPASGMTTGGEAVILRGAGFTSDSVVRFGGVNAAVTAVDAQAGTIAVTAPPHAVGTVDVFVQNSLDSAVLSSGYTYRADATPFIAAVHPRSGPVAGGNSARVTGYGLDDGSVEVRFGAVAATVSQRTATWADVVVPAGVVGAVDVSLVGATELARKDDAYLYVADLAISGVAPDVGPDTGGSAVTISGVGFAEGDGVDAVLFGGVPADFIVNSDGSIAVTTPARTAGVVDVVVERGDERATLPGAYTFEGSLDVWGFTPGRGAIAGGTYVEVRGRGFVGELGVALDNTPGRDVQRIDRNNLRFFTPPHSVGEVDLVVTADGRTAQGPHTFLYFDPASRFGGASGGAVDGAINVTVFANGGGPLAGAFVMVSTRADTPYQGWTNGAGQVTLSGAELRGAQTTTATAAGYSSATIQTVDAENITLFLSEIDPQSGTGEIEPPPRGTIRGVIRASGKPPNAEDERGIDMAMVGTTTRTISSRNPPPGPGAVVIGQGNYQITTRIGDMAVVGLCGSYDEATNTFTPLLMAVERFVYVANRDDLVIDLFCDIPLDQTHTYKLVNAPYAPDGPNNNLVEVHWDFGFEGFFESPVYGRGFGPLVEVSNQPALEGVLADMRFASIAGAFTGFGAPMSQARSFYIDDPSPPITMPVLLDVPELVSPMPDGTVGEDRMIRLQAAGPYLPDFTQVVLRNAMGMPVWTFFLPGNSTEIKLPEFPDFSAVPIADRPAPIVGGPLYLTATSARVSGGHVYENFDYRDLSVDVWEAYAVASWLIQLR